MFLLIAPPILDHGRHRADQHDDHDRQSIFPNSPRSAASSSSCASIFIEPT
jgi:hypothetical protein